MILKRQCETRRCSMSSIIRGATFDVRGIGVPGSPIVLIGFTNQVAWGMTALGADQADLFKLETDPSRPINIASTAAGDR